MEENEIYAIKTLRIYPKQMAGLRADKEMKREIAVLLKSKNVTCCSEYDNKPVPMQAANVEGMNQASNFSCWMKGSANETQVPCPNFPKDGWCWLDGSEIYCLLTRLQEQVQVLPSI